MTAGRFGLRGIGNLVRTARAALRASEPVVFQEYRPLPPAEVRLHGAEPLPKPPNANKRGAVWVALGVSLAIHAGILAYVLTHQLILAEPDAGFAKSASTPISVELVDTRIMRTTVEGQQTEAAPAPSTPPALAAASAPPEPTITAALPEETRETIPPAPPVPVAAPEKVAAAAPQEARNVATPQPPILAAPSGESSEATSPTSPDAKVTAVQPQTDPQSSPLQEREPADAKEAPKPEAKRKTENRKRQRHASLGAHASAGERGAETSAAQRSASRGAAISYRNSVQGHLAARRPSGGAGSGTVKVAFLLSASGSVMSAHIARSSGKPALDHKALSAVRAAAPYPSAPTGAGMDIRSFTMPFYFQ